MCFASECKLAEYSQTAKLFKASYMNESRGEKTQKETWHNEIKGLKKNQVKFKIPKNKVKLRNSSLVLNCSNLLHLFVVAKS